MGAAFSVTELNKQLGNKVKQTRELQGEESPEFEKVSSRLYILRLKSDSMYSEEEVEVNACWQDAWWTPESFIQTLYILQSGAKLIQQSISHAPF